ncbi:transposase [Pseudomonas sp. Leaf127]|uniref:REP-associated tyrosine transposase n=1 Tax=Pseudomonas TaxID=286 RepID=UPI000702E6F1|nr:MULTISPECIES: transposase [Pseudomonas]KQQ64367.1 transposase [Pseudomonas sp. Leaf127]
MPVHHHAHYLRLGRHSIHGQIYLVTCVVRNRDAVFSNLWIGRRRVTEMRSLHVAGYVRSLAWVVMPDHVHWLFEVRSGSLSQLMQRLKGRSAYVINKHFGNKMLCGQKGYHDHAARRDEDVLKMARYVIANPIRAGLVQRVGDYPLWDAVWIP